ncbi:MAG: hypothetical protein ACETWK_07990 [Candidatus Aminicenantaceae bacterium]
MIELYTGIVVVLIVQSFKQDVGILRGQSGVQEFRPDIIPVVHSWPCLLGFVLVAVIDTETNVDRQPPRDNAVLGKGRETAGVVILPHHTSLGKRAHPEPALLA